MKKFLSYIPKAAHQIYGTLFAAATVALFVSGAAALVVGILALILFAIVGVFLALALTAIFSIPNRVFRGIARYLDPDYNQISNDAMSKVVDAMETASSKVGSTKKDSDLSAMVNDIFKNAK